MRAAIYCRVSTDKQEAQNQLTQLKAYAQRCNYQTQQEYTDIISGKETSRPAYDQMFQHAHQKKFDVVLFWDLSRFSRAGTLHTLQKLKELENLGIQWESYNEPYLRNNGQFSEVALSVIASIAQLEHEKISERTKIGMQRARREGKPIGKRGKDKKKRRRLGYYIRAEREKNNK